MKFTPTLAMLIAGMTTPVLAQTPEQQQPPMYLQQRLIFDQGTVLDVMYNWRTVLMQEDKAVQTMQKDAATMKAALDAKDKQIADLTKERDALKPPKSDAPAPEASPTSK
jgi:hypothetical protein